MILKVISANSVDPDQEQSDLGPHCLPVCKNWFEKFAIIFSRRHKQTTFLDAGLLGALRVNNICLATLIHTGTCIHLALIIIPPCINQKN